MKKVDMTAFRKDCEKINKRMGDYPGKTETARLYRKLYEPAIASRLYRRKKVYFCTECGGEVQWLGQSRCPHCGARWTDRKVRDLNGYQHIVQRRDAVIFEAKGDIQLTRYYRVERCVRFGKPVSVFAWETMRFFYAPNGERVTYQRAVNGMTMYYDSFSRWSKLYYRRELSPNNMGYGALQRANLRVCYWGVKSLTRQWKHKNAMKLLDDYDGDTSVVRLIAYPYAETMLKCGQSKLFHYLVGQGQRLPRRAENAANLCIRHKYTVDDPSIWLDTLYLLVMFGYDIHNPKFICPENLKELHNALVKRKKRMDDARLAKQREERARQLAEWQARYNAELAQRQAEKARQVAEMSQHWAEHFGKMLSIDIKGTDISIRPLQSIDEFKEEGEHMHHCVYQCEYYNYYRHPATLILSAKDGNNKRLATIEYNMRTNEVVQCRAACNEVPPRKAEIIQLLADHKAQFIEYEKTVLAVKQSA